MIHNQQINTFPYAHRLGHYRIIKKIGQGGMSSVYEGFDEKLQRPIAIKILHPFLAEQEEHKKRFFREAQAGAQLSHPNIIQIYDVAVLNTKESLVYMVTELINGVTLKQFIQSHSLKEIPEFCCMIIWQIASALEHAHQKGIIHRDIKSENIMISNNGVIKLMDFGIASINNDENLTQTGALLGSFAYMAPEIIKGNKASIQSDIFSLSVIFYWLLTEKMPFNGANHHMLLKQIVEEEVKKLQSLSLVIVDELAEIVEKGLNKNPHKRYSSMQELKLVIEKFLANFSIYIDEKIIIKTLKNPDIELENIYKKILKQIKYQLKTYKKNKEKIKYTILSQRIAGKRYINKNYYFILIFILFLLIIVFVWIDKKRKYENKQLTQVDLLPKEIAIEENNINEITDVQTTHSNLKEIKTCEVSIDIWPFATVILDKKQIAKNTEKVNIKLTKGNYHFTFLHPYAASYEKNIIINEEKKIHFKVNLIKAKPAFLIIESLIDADVIIDEQYYGTTKASESKPIILQIPDKNHARNIKISLQKEGYVNFVDNVEVIAGNTKRLKIFLEKIK